MGMSGELDNNEWKNGMEEMEGTTEWEWNGI